MTATLDHQMTRSEIFSRLRTLNLGDVLNVVVTRTDLNRMTRDQGERLLHLYDVVQNARYEADRITR